LTATRKTQRWCKGRREPPGWHTYQRPGTADTTLRSYHDLHSRLQRTATEQPPAAGFCWAMGWIRGPCVTRLMGMAELTMHAREDVMSRNLWQDCRTQRFLQCTWWGPGNICHAVLLICKWQHSEASASTCSAPHWALHECIATQVPASKAPVGRRNTNMF